LVGYFLHNFQTPPPIRIRPENAEDALQGGLERIPGRIAHPTVGDGEIDSLALTRFHKLAIIQERL
jgi:hypothetical protein